MLIEQRDNLGRLEDLKLVFDREVRGIELALTSTDEPAATRINYDRGSRRFDVSFDQATALVIAAVSAAAIGFLPAGLGAREAIAAILSPIVGIPAAVGLVITAVDRVINLVVLSAFAGIVTFATRRERKAARAAARSPV